MDCEANVGFPEKGAGPLGIYTGLGKEVHRAHFVVVLPCNEAFFLEGEPSLSGSPYPSLFGEGSRNPVCVLEGAAKQGSCYNLD